MANAYATVATAAPLTLYFGSDRVTQVPAEKLSSYSPAAGDYVRVELRTPLVPIVLAKVGD